MATHSSILAWRLLMDGGAWQATVRGVPKDLDVTEHECMHSEKRPKRVMS